MLEDEDSIFLHGGRVTLYIISGIEESFEESMHGRVARVRIWHRVERRGEASFGEQGEGEEQSR